MIVVKVGGSLFDHPALGPGLRRWLGEQDDACLLVPGGGPSADVIRQFHHTHSPPEELSHWLAIRMMDVNGELLRHLVAEHAEVVSAFDFCQSDEGASLSLPHDWRVTSDAIAARIAEARQASQLIVLKSVDMDPSIDWGLAAQRGLVDQLFGEVVERAGMPVRWINFRILLDGHC